MLEPENEEQKEAHLRELLEAMEREIAEFRRLKEGGLGMSEGPPEPAVAVGVSPAPAVQHGSGPAGEP
jgi:hypothetical protein